MLPSVHAAALAGVRHVVVPAINAAEARLVRGLGVHAVASLRERSRRCDLARGRAMRGRVPEPPQARPSASARTTDLSDVLGQSEAKIALEIAAAGEHHLLLAGPPAPGKTMLAERLGVAPAAQ